MTEACSVVMECNYPQFYSFMAMNADLLMVEASRFPTFIAVAKVLYRGDKNSSTVEDISFAVGANPNTVQSLVKLHLTAIPQI